MNDNQSITNGVIRTGAATGGGAMLVGSQNELVQLVGALITLCTLIWSIYEKLQARKQSPPPTVPPAALSVLCLLSSVLLVSAADVKLAWDPSASLNVTNYTLHVGTNSGVYPVATIHAGTNTTATFSNASLGIRYFFVVRATDSNGLVSDPSNEVNWLVPTNPPAPLNLRILSVTYQVTVPGSSN